MPARRFKSSPKPERNKSHESWNWEAACSIRNVKDAPKYKNSMLLLTFAKRYIDLIRKYVAGGERESVQLGCIVKAKYLKIR